MGKSRKPGRNSGKRALSVGRGRWQLHAGLLALSLAVPALGAPGGQITTLPIGAYRCELPGDATGPAGLRQPDEDFTIVSSSSYRSGGSMGSYLLTDSELTMTSGPREGRRQSGGFVRLIDSSGLPGDLRCVKQHRNTEPE
jgi:hypothetical protein